MLARLGYRADVAANGLEVVKIQRMPRKSLRLTLLSLAAVLLVASTLSRRRSRGERGAGRLAWGVSIATVILGLVGGGSLFGVALFLLLACVAVPGRPSTGAGAGIDPWHSARGV